MDYILTANGIMSYDAYLAHHGVKGMKWGVRRYQDYGEGGYTPESTGTYKQHKKALKLDRRASIQARSTEEQFKSIMRERTYNRAKMNLKKSNFEQKSKAYAEMGKDKKVAKMDKKSRKMDAKIKDFDEGTKYISKAHENIKEAANTLSKLKANAVYDKSIKKSPEYKQAKKWCNNLFMSDYGNYGRAGTYLQEAHSIAKNKPSYVKNGKAGAAYVMRVLAER